MKKYVLTENRKVMDDKYGNKRTLIQVQALKEFKTITGDTISAGDFGGWVESEENLSQQGNAWLDKESYAFDTSVITGNAYIKNSSLFDAVFISGDSTVEESKLFDSTIVTSQSEIEKSELYGQTVLGGYCRVVHSNLSNVQVKTGSSKDKKSWNSYHFENTFLKAEEFMIEVRENLTCKDVHLSGRRILFETKASLECVTGENIRDFIIKQETEMYCVKLKRDASMMSLVKSDKTVLVGVLSEPEDKGIVIDSTCLLLSGVTIRDNVQMYGAWEIENSMLSDKVVLRNEGNHSIELVNSYLSELAQVIAKPNHSLYDTLELEMEADEIHEIH